MPPPDPNFRATVDEKSLVFWEPTPGAAGVPGVEILSASFEPTMQADIKFFAPAGSEADTVAQMAREWSQTGGNFQGDFNAYCLLHLCHTSKVNPTKPAGFTLANQWLITPSNNIQTFALDNGDDQAGYSQRTRYNFIPTINITGNRDGINGTFTALGKRMEDGFTLGPSAPVAKRVFDVNHMDVWIANSLTELNAQDDDDAYSEAANWNFKSDGRWAPNWFIGTMYGGSFSGKNKVKPTVELSLQVSNTPLGQGLKQRMRANQFIYVRVRCLGEQIELSSQAPNDPIYYTYELKFCGAIKQGAGKGNRDGASTLEWTLNGMRDDTGFWYSHRFINMLPALA